MTTHPATNRPKPLNIKHCISLGLLLLLSVLSISPLYAASKKKPAIDISDRYKKQRTIFLKAESTLKKGQYSKYRKYYRQLKGYPLQPYLRYREYRKKLSSLPEADVLAFFEQYKDTPYADWLRVNWLDKKLKTNNGSYILMPIPPRSLWIVSAITSML